MAASKPLIVTSPSIATGTPFSNLTEYSNTSPASVAVIEPDDKSVTGLPASAASSTVLITTEEESLTPVSVIVPVLSLSLPRLITVLPFISEATSTLDTPPAAKSAGDPDAPDEPAPRRTITSDAGSKLAIVTLPSRLERTEEPFELNVTS